MNDERTTPQWLFDELDAIFHFTLDAAATADNTKCKEFYTIADDALTQGWQGNTFVNPPYSRGRLQKWVNHARIQAVESRVVVMLLPADTSTRWFPWDAKLVFLRKRVAFDGIKAGAKFPTVIAIWNYHPRDALNDVGVVVG